MTTRRRACRRARCGRSRSTSTDILYWIEREPEFGRQAVYLEDAESAGQLPDAAEFKRLRAQGVRIWAPPLFALLALDDRGAIVPSPGARDARAAGLELVTWSLERSGPLGAGQNGWYYQTVDSALRSDSDVLQVLDVLATAGPRARRVQRLARHDHLLRKLHRPGLIPATHSSINLGLARMNRRSGRRVSASRRFVWQTREPP